MTDKTTGSASKPSGFTRRDALKTAAIGAAMTGMARFQPAAAMSSSTFDKELFLLDRTTFGYDKFAPLPGAPTTSTMAAEIASRGYTGFLNWQLGTAGTIDTSAARAQIKDDNFQAWNIWDMTPGEILQENANGVVYDNPCLTTIANSGVAIEASIRAVILNGHRTPDQLRATTGDFWNNVHNTHIKQPAQHLYWMQYYRQVALDSAFGKYEDMVIASAKSASMMLYLDQKSSVKGNPIENYARELMELHTCSPETYGGVITSYTEPDVQAVADILTGWTYNETSLPQLGDFFFNGTNHEYQARSVSITGQSYGPNGLADGEQLIRDLARLNHSAFHITYRLINWFLGDLDWTQGASQDFYTHWGRVAGAYANSQGNLTTTIKTLFDLTHISETRPRRYTKIRRPLNLALSVMRATGAEHNCALTDWSNAWSAFFGMGQIPGNWPSPDGHPSDNAAWMNSMTTRVQFLYDIVFLGDELGLNITPARLEALFPTPVTWTSLAQLANDRLFGCGLPAHEVAYIQTYLNTLPHATVAEQETKRRFATFLTFASPSYQYHY